MRKRNILIHSILVVAFYFMFPQSTADSMAARAAAVQTAEPVVVQEEEQTEGLYRKDLAAYITSVNKAVTEEEAAEMVDCIMQQAEKHQLDERLIMAVAQTESTYYSDAVSSADYKGLMQTSDVLAEEAGYTPEDLFDPEVSIQIGSD